MSSESIKGKPPNEILSGAVICQLAKLKEEPQEKRATRGATTGPECTMYQGFYKRNLRNLIFSSEWCSRMDFISLVLWEKK